MTSKLTITRERLQEIAEDGFLKHGESKELARMALAAMDCEPVAHVDPHCVHNIIWTDYGVALENIGVGAPLFAAPHPAPVVPDAEAVYARLSDHEKWSTSLENVNHVLNACRAAMLQAGNSPVIPGWIPISEKLPERGDWLVTDGCDFDVQLFNGEQFIPGFVWEDKITHWMPLPADPQEVNHG